MEEFVKQFVKDCQEIEHLKGVIIQAARKDTYNINNPQNQITTLSFLANELLKDNEDGKNDPLIGFYANVAQSIKRLIQLETLNELEYGKY